MTQCVNAAEDATKGQRSCTRVRTPHFIPSTNSLTISQRLHMGGLQAMSSELAHIGLFTASKMIADLHYDELFTYPRFFDLWGQALVWQRW